MKAVAHPFFGTLYIDPVEGLYWETTLPAGEQQTKVAVSVDDPRAVTGRSIEYAASCIADLEILHSRGKRALANNLRRQPDGACARYWARHLSHLDGSALAATLATPHPVTLSRKNFLDHLTLTLAAFYPANPDIPIILEYSLGTQYTSAVVNVAFTPQADALEVLLEE